MKVELLHIVDCPNTAIAGANARAALDAGSAHRAGSDPHQGRSGEHPIRRLAHDPCRRRRPISDATGSLARVPGLGDGGRVRRCTDSGSDRGCVARDLSLTSNASCRSRTRGRVLHCTSQEVGMYPNSVEFRFNV